MCLHIEKNLEIGDKSRFKIGYKVFNEMKNGKLNPIKYRPEEHFELHGYYHSDYGYHTFVDKNNAIELANTLNRMIDTLKRFNPHINKLVVKKVKILGLIKKGFSGYNQNTILGYYENKINSVRHTDMRILE